MARYLAISTLCALLLGSLALSCWAINFSVLKLPSGDVIQHVTLVEQAATGNIDCGELFHKYNHLHFIPIPKLIYALDIVLDGGNGRLTATASIALTLLCCLFFTRSVFDISTLSQTEKACIALLTASWLVCILQWESFVNPGDLQWSGLNASLALIAAGLRQRPVWLIAGAVLAIGFGAQWSILLIACLLLLAPPKNIWASICVVIVLALLWELANALWLQRYLPLPALVIGQIMPLSPEEITNIKNSFFNNPVSFYVESIKILLTFVTRFCFPPIDKWLPAGAIVWFSPLLLLSIFLANRQQNWRGFTFMATTALLTGLAAGLVRGYLTTAYTSRFANIGLLFVSSCFVLGYAACQKKPWHKWLWWLLAALYSALLFVTVCREAANIVHGSNQRRISQVAYALDIHDSYATSETPYAPLRELSYQQISELKSVWADNHIGIYHSYEHRIFTNEENLPTEETNCLYTDIRMMPLKIDQTALKVIGKTSTIAGQVMSSVLIQDTRNIALGYGIFQVPGLALTEQLTGSLQWGGFFHLPDNGQVRITAYNPHQRCQPEVITIPGSQ